MAPNQAGYFFARLLDEDIFEAVFFDALFFLLAPFFGIFAPARRASLNPIAIACFGFFTFFLPPDFNSPCLNSCMVFCILLLTVLFDFGSEPDEDRFFEPDRFELDFFVVAIYEALTEPRA